MSGQRGVALILVVLVTSFLSAIGMGLALMVMMDSLATGNLRGSVALLYAADAALELAARELAQLDDWDRALTGEVRSSFVDGEPAGVRLLAGGGTVNLTATTNALNCGQVTACSDAQMNHSTRERPWGANNARWRLFAHGPLGGLGPLARPADCYIAVWIADDAGEEDGDPLSDSPGPGAPGSGVVRIRAEAFGLTGSRRAIEAELARRCRPGGPENCRPGIRVQSWSEVRQTVP